MNVVNALNREQAEPYRQSPFNRYATFPQSRHGECCCEIGSTTNNYGLLQNASAYPGIDIKLN